MSLFLADLRYAARVLRKTPAFSLIVIAVLALGIGANTAVFSVVDAVLLRGLPFPRADRLVMIWEKNPSLGALIGDRVPVALSNFMEWQKRATRFESIAGYEEANFNLTQRLRTGAHLQPRPRTRNLGGRYFRSVGGVRSQSLGIGSISTRPADSALANSAARASPITTMKVTIKPRKKMTMT